MLEMLRMLFFSTVSILSQMLSETGEKREEPQISLVPKELLNLLNVVVRKAEGSFVWSSWGLRLDSRMPRWVPPHTEKEGGWLRQPGRDWRTNYVTKRILDIKSDENIQIFFFMSCHTDWAHKTLVVFSRQHFLFVFMQDFDWPVHEASQLTGWSNLNIDL